MNTIELPAEVNAQEIRALYDSGRVLQAYRRGLAWGTLTEWPGVEGGILASRIAYQLGAPRLSHWILRRLRRQWPNHPEVRYAYAYVLCHRRGTYATWRWMHENLELGPEADADLQASWYGLLGQLAGGLRDFETAEKWLARGEAADPGNAWLQVCWSSVLEQQDRYDEALAAARRALAERPTLRAAIQATGHLLTLKERDDEALELYTDAMKVMESSAIAAGLYGLQMELRDYPAAEKSLEELIRLSPLAEKGLKKWIAAQKSELAFFRGDVAEAIAQARISDTPYFKTIADNLEDPVRQERREVLLSVPFVRQHHLTCVPATLSAISRFWSMPAEHLQVADEICYCGTTSHNERKWAEEHGWVAREFSVTEESAQALIDRGIPFTFTTVELGNAHLQAIIGYNSRRGTLHVRDPFWRNTGETLTEKLLERYRPYGPRGMALVPREKQELLDGLDLPDAPLWDLLHALDAALVKHRREAAQEVYDALRAQAPGHRLTIEARRRLAIYDANPTEQLAAVEQMLEQFPEDERLIWERLALMRFQASREQRLETFRELCRKPETHPMFWQGYAQELRQDARQHDQVIHLMQKAIRRWPSDAVSYFILAHVLWDQRRWEEALELYRIAACLEDKDEQLVRGYFAAATWVKETDALLKLLRDRFERNGRKSSLPARTLASSLLQLSREQEALEVLEEAMRLRPDDGSLMLHAADTYLMASSENLPRSTELLESAKDISPRPEWLRTAARLASAAGDPASALALWRQVVELQPLNYDAHRAVARLLAETEGTAAALAHLRSACERFPHHHPLHVLWVEWLRDEPPEAREDVVRRVVALAPDDAWSHRELGTILASLQRLDEAWECAEIAGRLEPYNPSYRALRAGLYRRQNQLAEAKAELREAIRLSVDFDFAINEWMELCATRAERREALLFVRDELVRQVTFGEGLLAFREHARGVLEADELLGELQAALAARPDLWHAWSAVAMQLLHMNRLDDAMDTVRQANERFPLQARLWVDRAQICRARMEFDDELSALENALRIDPGWSTALHEICECLQRRADYAQAKALAQQAVLHAPLDGYNHVALAEQMWRLGERDAALERLQRAVAIEPGLKRAWDLLQEWSQTIGRPKLAIETARELTTRRGGEARSWLVLAQMLDPVEMCQERLDALERAIELNPRSVEAYDQRAKTLALAGRFDEALAACQVDVFDGHVPAEIGARAAWIEGQRGDLRKAIERMRAVVADEPHYYGGWACLHDWCQRIGDHAGMLESAQAMVQISPQYEISMGYLAEALLLNGRREEARETYARAFELSPDYEYTGNALFDMQMEDGDLEGAARTMEVLRQHSTSGYVLGRDVQLAIRQHDIERALQDLRTICVTASESRWPVVSAVGELRQAGQSDKVEEILTKALAMPDVQSDVGLALVEVVLERLEHDDGDVRSELYRFERGLGHSKAYASAWSRLADHYRVRNEHENYSRCAQAMVQCDPENEMSYGYLGEARLQCDDRKGAVQALRQAVSINPQYDFAWNLLLHMYFEDNDLSAAQELIEYLTPRVYHPNLVARQVQLAARQKDEKTAAARLRELCNIPTEESWGVDHAIGAMQEADMAWIAEEILSDEVERPEALPAVAAAWVRLAVERNTQGTERRVLELLEHPQVGEATLHHWFESLARRGRNSVIQRFIADHGKRLAAETRYWGIASWASTLIRDYKLTSRWSADWRQRPDARPWMLVNVAEGFRATGRLAEAIEVSHYALTLPPDNGTHLHHLWRGCDAACDGAFDAAREHFAQVREQDLDRDYLFLHVLLRAMLTMADAPPDQRAEAFATARALVNAEYTSYDGAQILEFEPGRKQMLFRAAARIAALSGTFGGRLWGLWWKLRCYKVV